MYARNMQFDILLFNYTSVLYVESETNNLLDVHNVGLN